MESESRLCPALFFKLLLILPILTTLSNCQIPEPNPLDLQTKEVIQAIRDGPTVSEYKPPPKKEAIFLYFLHSQDRMEFSKLFKIGSKSAQESTNLVYPFETELKGCGKSWIVPEEDNSSDIVKDIIPSAFHRKHVVRKAARVKIIIILKKEDLEGSTPKISQFIKDLFGNMTADVIAPSSVGLVILNDKDPEKLLDNLVTRLEEDPLLLPGDPAHHLLSKILEEDQFIGQLDVGKDHSFPKALERLCRLLQARDASLVESTITYRVSKNGKVWLTKAVKRLGERIETNLAWAFTYLKNRTLRFLENENNTYLVTPRVQKVTEGLSLILSQLEAGNLTDLSTLGRHLITTGHGGGFPISHSFFLEMKEREKELHLLAKMEGVKETRFNTQRAVPHLQDTLRTLQPQDDWYTFLSSGYECLSLKVSQRNGSEPNKQSTLNSTDYKSLVDNVAGECKGKVTKPQGVGVPQGRAMIQVQQVLKATAQQNPVSKECGTREGFEHLYIISGTKIDMMMVLGERAKCDIDDILITATEEVEINKEYNHEGNGTTIILAPNIVFTQDVPSITLSPPDKRSPPTPPVVEFVQNAEEKLCFEYCIREDSLVACEKKCREEKNKPGGDPCDLIDFSEFPGDLAESRHGTVGANAQSFMAIYNFLQVPPSLRIIIARSEGGYGGNGQDGLSTTCGWPGVRGLGAPGGYPGYIHFIPLVLLDLNKTEPEFDIRLLRGKRGDDGKPGTVHDGRNITIWEDPDMPLPKSFLEPFPAHHNISRTLMLGLDIGFDIVREDFQREKYLDFFNNFLKDRRIMQYFKSMELGRMALFINKLNVTLRLDPKRFKELYQALHTQLDLYAVGNLEYHVPSVDCGRPYLIPHEEQIRCTSSSRVIEEPGKRTFDEADDDEDPNAILPPTERSKETQKFVEEMYQSIGSILGTEDLAPVSLPVDVLEYLDYVEEVLNDEEEDDEDTVIREATRKYQDEIDSRADQIDIFLTTYFIPRLDGVIMDTKAELLESIKAVKDYQQATDDEIIALRKARLITWAARMVKWVCKILKPITQIFLPKVKPIVSGIGFAATVVQKGGKVYEDMRTRKSKESLQQLDTVFRGISKEHVSSQIQALDVQMGRIKARVESLEEAEDPSVPDTVDLTLLVGIYEEQKSRNLIDPREIKRTARGMVSTLRIYEGKYENDKKQKDNVEFFQEIKTRLNILKDGAGIIDIYSEIAEDNVALKVYSDSLDPVDVAATPNGRSMAVLSGAIAPRDSAETLEDLRTRLQNLDQIEAAIDRFAIPLVQNVGDSLKHLVATGDISDVALILRKRDVRKILDFLRTQLITLGQVKGENRMPQLIDEFDSIMTDVLQLQEESTRLANHKTLVTLLGDLASPPKQEVKLTPSQTQIVNEIEKNPRERCLKFLWLYNRALAAFKQQVFPLAFSYPTTFLLPELLGDERDVRKRMSDKIENVKQAINLHRSTIHGSSTVHLIFLEFYNTTSSKPFYTWDYDQYESSIKSMLQGKPTIMVADILYSPDDLDAIKFKRIDLKFRVTGGANEAERDQVQKDLDDCLNFFKIRLKHTGTSYYRVSGKYYKMMSPAFSVNYSFERDSINTTIPRGRSGAYDKMANGYFSLSPYTSWVIHLDKYVKGNFTLLEQILDKPDIKLNLELSGEGMYLEPGIEEKDVTDYYEVDELTTDVKKLKADAILNQPPGP